MGKKNVEGLKVEEKRESLALDMPDWQCDFFRLTSTKGAGNGESFKYFAIHPGDCLLADRGFSHLAGIGHVYRHGGSVIVRLHDQNTPLENEDGSQVVLLGWLEKLSKSGQVGGISVWLPAEKGSKKRIQARLCAIRKSVEATTLAERKLRRRASRKQSVLREITLDHSAWIVVLTTVEKVVLSDVEVLEWYRVRWQIELAFKRLKSLGDVGHLPKHDAASSRAWVYGKLLIALLSEKMQRHAVAFSPWVDDGWSKTRHRSFWREGELLLNLVRDALWPELSIKNCLENWTVIQRDLAEGRRNRTPRVKILLS